MKVLFIFSIILLDALTMHAEKHDTVWISGMKASIDTSAYRFRTLNDTDCIFYAIESRTDSAFMMIGHDMSMTRFSVAEEYKTVLTLYHSGDTLKRTGKLINQDLYWLEYRAGGLAVVYDKASSDDKKVFDNITAQIEKQIKRRQQSPAEKKRRFLFKDLFVCSSS